MGVVTIQGAATIKGVAFNQVNMINTVGQV